MGACACVLAENASNKCSVDVISLCVDLVPAMELAE